MDSDNLVNNINNISATIKKNITNFSFQINNSYDSEIKSILEKSFVIYAYGYLEGLIKKISKDYLNFVFQYCENNSDAIMITPLYYLYKFKEFKCKNTNKYFKTILNGLEILNINNDNNNYTVKANNNLKYDVLVMILHLLQFDLKNYETFKYSFIKDDNSEEEKELNLQNCLNDFVDDRNKIAHGDYDYIQGTFKLKNPWEIYKVMVISILDNFTKEVINIISEKSFLR